MTLAIDKKEIKQTCMSPSILLEKSSVGTKYEIWNHSFYQFSTTWIHGDIIAKYGTLANFVVLTFCVSFLKYILPQYYQTLPSVLIVLPTCAVRAGDPWEETVASKTTVYKIKSRLCLLFGLHQIKTGDLQNMQIFKYSNLKYLIILFINYNLFD